MSFSVTGTTFVRADRDDVWTALHDVRVIGACIPGCRALDRTSEHAFTLRVEVPLGPTNLIFDGVVEIVASDAPRLYRLEGSGKGPMGSAAGSAEIRLKREAGGCRLAYDVLAETQGPMRAIGPVVLSGLGKAIAAVFAKRFADTVRSMRRGDFVAKHQRA